MSGYYGLNHIIKECLDEKAKVNTTARGKSEGAKTDIYQSSWNALNTWIESKLAKQKGAGISGFGCFCWELKQRDGITHCRPLFILSDAFVKSFKIKQQRIHHPPQTTSIEEVNYSLLAIKFSKNLTKDMVFSGIRDILRKIGDFIYRGYELEIQFSFGTLRSKERRMRFEFNQTRLQQILPEKMEPGIYAYDASPMAYVEEESENGDPAVTSRTADDEPEWQRPSTSARMTSTVPSLNLTQKNLADSQMRASTASLNQFRPTLQLSSNQQNDLHSILCDSVSFNDTAPLPSSSEVNGTRAKTFEEFERELNYQETLPTELSDLLDTLAKNKTGVEKKAFREKAAQRVAEQAYLRCLEGLDDHARLDDNTLFESTSSFNEWKSSLQRQKEANREQTRTMKQALDEQVARNSEKAELERIEKRNTMMRFILPDNAGMTQSSLGSSIGPDGKVINSRQKISKDLEAQIQHNAEKAERLKAETSNKERDYLKRLSLEIDLHSVMERSQHLEKQKAMLEAWEKEGHIRNLRKLQPFGRNSVQQYMETNLAETTGNMTVNLPSNTIGGAINKSIGYDPRRGRMV